MRELPFGIEDGFHFTLAVGNSCSVRHVRSFVLNGTTPSPVWFVIRGVAGGSSWRLNEFRFWSYHASVRALLCVSSGQSAKRQRRNIVSAKLPFVTGSSGAQTRTLDTFTSH